MNQKQTETKIDAPGVLLNKARIAAGLSVPQIASRMNLANEVIEGIEADNYQQSLSPAFYRGYLRTYAQIVDLDADELVSSFNHSINQGSLSTSITPTFDTDLYTQKDRQLPILKWFVITSLVVVLSIALYFLWTKIFTGNNKQQIEIPLQSDTSVEIALPFIESTDEVTEVEKNSEQIANLNIPEETESATAVPVFDNDVKLLMNFSGDCWVKVTDNNGKVLALGIKRSGKVMELAGDAPFNIILGNSSAVIIKYNAQTVDLSSFPPGNRVEFTVSVNSELLR